MDKLIRTVLLHSRTRTFSSLLSCRQIYSKTGIWPSDRELTTEVKQEVENYWKRKFSEEKDDPHISAQGAKKYVLAMFPYPSGKLHMGHVRVYAISDAMARFYRLRGFKVIHPMGWDAFGLPAENAAIENNMMPDEWTYANVAQMKAQLLDLGCKFDWDCEFATCDPTYYKWTQYIFLLLYNAGLAYQKEALVNWDPIDQTVLAHEQVDENGRSWRSGALVEKKYLKQWFIKTTRFSKSLWDGLSSPLLEYWQDIPKVQEHWIGECDGYRVEMTLAQSDKSKSDDVLSDTLHLWMTQPELIYGISFIGIRSDHKLNTDAYLGPKTGIYQMLNVKAVCPLSRRQIPIIVCDDLEFHPGQDYYVGIASRSRNDSVVARTCKIHIAHVSRGEVLINSGNLSGLEKKSARERVVEDLLKHRSGGYQTSAKLRDWLISRQRYWGTPIPIIHCPSCGTVAVPLDQLPVELPKITESLQKEKSPLKDNDEWRVCPCPRCGGSAERETDTMDTFADSSWYFLRFLDAHNAEKPFDFNKQAAGMPVDLYVGGKEHAELHMFYARFIQHFLASEGLVSHQEPFRRLVVQGMVMGKSYKVKDTGKYLKKEEVDFSVDPPAEHGTGAALEISNEKMSKSKHNGVDPQDVMDEYGADTTRLLMLANYAPFSQRNWSTETFPGVLRWQNRIWLTVTEFIEERQNKHQGAVPELSDDEIKKHRESLWESRNFSVRGATYCMQENHQLSTGISFMQGLTTTLRKVPRSMMLDEEFELGLAAQIIMIAPITPHLASELWAGFCSLVSSPMIKKELPLLQQSWPEVDQNYEIPLRFVFLPEILVKTISLPRRIVDTLTESTAVEAMMNIGMQKRLEVKKVVNVKLNVIPGVSATVELGTMRMEPERTENQQIERSVREKEAKMLEKKPKKEKREKKKKKRTKLY